MSEACWSVKLVSWLCFIELQSLSKVPRPRRLPLYFEEFKVEVVLLSVARIFLWKSWWKDFFWYWRLSPARSVDQCSDCHWGPYFFPTRKPPAPIPQGRFNWLFIKHLFNQSINQYWPNFGKLEEIHEQVLKKIYGTSDKQGCLGTFEEDGINGRCVTPAIMLLVKIMLKFLVQNLSKFRV